MEVSSLIIPRVEVYWGPVNLTSPTKTPDFYANLSSLKDTTLDSLGPLVYDVRVGMEDQGQTPNGSMRWNPTGVGFEVYQRLLNQYIDYSIIITFYYVSGGYIPFEFYWGGQTETYGKDMDLNVKLVTLLDGLVNANMYATAQADKEEKGSSHKDSLSKLEKAFGIKDYGLIEYTEAAEKDMGKAIVKVSYNDGSNFMDAVQNLVKDNGNNVFFNNIGTAKALVFTPYLWEVQKEINSLQSPMSRLSPSGPTTPDPKKRYTYLLGPEIIQSFTRSYEWQPPQKSQEISSALGRKPESKKARARQNRNNRTVPDAQQSTTQSRATAPQGVHGSKGSSSNIRSANNQDGPKKQDLFTKERSAKLSATLFMCPALVGIKPLDIIFIGSYAGGFVEDWIVSSVEYQQTQGGVDISIQATRPFGFSEGGMGKTMTVNPPVLAGASLEEWQQYAWKEPLPYNKAALPPQQGTQFTPPPVSGTAGVSSANSADFQAWFKETYPDVDYNSLSPESQSMLQNTYQTVVVPTLSASPAATPQANAPQIVANPPTTTAEPANSATVAAVVQNVSPGSYKITDPAVYNNLKDFFASAPGVSLDDANKVISGLSPEGIAAMENIIITAEGNNPQPSIQTSATSAPQAVPSSPPGSPTPTPISTPMATGQSTSLTVLGNYTVQVNNGDDFLQWLGQKNPDFRTFIDFQTGVIRNVDANQIQSLYSTYTKAITPNP